MGRVMAAALALGLASGGPARAYYRGPVYGPGSGYNSNGATVGLVILGATAIILLGAGIGLAIDNSVHPPPPVVMMPPFGYPPPMPPPPVAYPP